MSVSVIHGDMRDVLGKMIAEGKVVQAVVTDPPYGLGFMGKKWDASANVAFLHGTWRLCFELLPPGGHLLAFAGTRTYHRMAIAIEEAGFEIRDTIGWLYGSGFPKSKNVSKAIDSEAGAEREIIGDSPFAARKPNGSAGVNSVGLSADAGSVITAPATDAARQWEGWGTALKPAMELICVARKPLDGTVAANVLKHGTGALNIDGCRVGVSGGGQNGRTVGALDREQWRQGPASPSTEDTGRWPANVCHDGSDEVVRAFPETQSGALNAGHKRGSGVTSWDGGGGIIARDYGNDLGSAARFFYSAKADADDRLGSLHPTVKPVDLMRWLVRLITPPGGTVLDPFAGSGTTGMACMAEGIDCILVEREAEYVADIKARIAHVHGEDTPLFSGVMP